MSNDILPSNIDAEQAFLGILINDIDVLTEIETVPLASDFYLERNKIIAKVLFDLKDGGQQVDIISLVEVLSANNLLEKVGREPYISELTDKGISSKNASYYADLIIEKSLRRSFLKYSHYIQDIVSDESISCNQLIERVEKELLSIAEREQGEKYLHANDILRTFLTRVKFRMSHFKVGEFSGIVSRYDKLDNLLAGFQPGELIIIAARASVGKTSFALNLINNIAIEDNVPTAFFSLEMSGLDIISRMISIRTGIPNERFRKNLINSTDLNKMMKIFSTKFQAPFYLADIPSMGIVDLKVMARRLVAKFDVKIIFIDYLGLIAYQTDAGKYSKSVYIPRFEQITEISKSLKSLARELQVPIIVLAQLNREAEGKKPTLANIRDSGAIEQDADVVIMLHKDRNNTGANQNDNMPPKIELTVQKNRHGPTGFMYFDYFGSRMFFKESSAGPQFTEDPKLLEDRGRL